MTMTIDKLKNTDMELIEMMIEAFNTDEKMADVISRFAAKHRKTEGSVKARWNKIRPSYIETARERGMTEIVEDAERRSELALKRLANRKRSNISSTNPEVKKKTSIKKQELFDRFNKSDAALDRLEQLQQNTLKFIEHSHKSNDARFNGVSSMLKLIVEKVEHPKQINHQTNGLISVNKFGQVQAVGMNKATHLDEDKVLALIDEHEKLEDELKNERDLRVTGEDLYNELKNEFNKLQDELTETKKKLDSKVNLLKTKEKIIDAQEILKTQLEHNNGLLTKINKELTSSNKKLTDINKLLNKRGLIDRLLNREVEYNAVTN